nr:reverse transcriptase domain-containing protein [Tanacetum cinerariifolium]
MSPYYGEISFRISEGFCLDIAEELEHTPKFSRGSGRPRGRSGDQSNGRNDGKGGQVGGQGSQGRGQMNGRNQNGDASNDHIQGDVRNVIENNDCKGCTYKEFLDFNPKEYDDFKTLTREVLCPSNEMKKLETKLWNYAMVEAGHAAYTDKFHELSRLFPHLVTPEGGQAGRGSGRPRGRSGDQSNGRNDGKRGQVGGQDSQGRGQRNGRNQNGDASNDHIQGDVRNVIENNDRKGCTYKEFLDFNPKEYD